MRRRLRHFNARDIGAKVAYDARFVDQAASTSVSSWTDRTATGWHATQSSSTLRPTFEVNKINGNPAVCFDGTDDRLDVTAGVSIFRNISSGLVMCVGRDRTPTAGNSAHLTVFLARSTDSSTRFLLLTRNTVATIQCGGRRLDSDSSTLTSNTVSIDSNATIFSGFANYSGGSYSVIKNNKTETTSNITSGSTSDSNSSLFSIGGQSAATQFSPIDMGQLAIFNTDIGAAGRARVHRTAAFAFKIACN